MQISWHGLSCFSLIAQTGSGEVSFVVDPYDNETGLRFPRTLTADLVVVSHAGKDAENVEAVGETGHGKKFVVDLPGEYEVKGIFVHAIDAGKDRRIFHVEVEGIKMAHLGALDRELTDAELDLLGNIDILFVPIGGGRVLSPKMATEVINQVEPRIVIPYDYAIDGLKEEFQPLDAFCKALGVCKREDVNKLKIARKNLPEDQMIIYVLNRD